MTDAQQSRPAPTRRRTILACSHCRKRKIRCITTEQPPKAPCARCTRRALRCEYVAAPEPACAALVYGTDSPPPREESAATPPAPAPAASMSVLYPTSPHPAPHADFPLFAALHASVTTRLRSALPPGLASLSLGEGLQRAREENARKRERHRVRAGPYRDPRLCRTEAHVYPADAHYENAYLAVAELGFALNPELRFPDDAFALGGLPWELA
ncbi:hypothetical protein B0H15DRAFT_866551 [Mycena belliarum]|uniref:Zn(2)-C6 fungal-type domain-containing protein n=1 Tax=Mycena belliarum TaxID=1033014 RepID=A0AAD6TUL3_9AGAR|nr:hypothetical protein B0H15DRAFT_866551 [Mycena belliae]